jgi:hypothetical protein
VVGGGPACLGPHPRAAASRLLLPLRFSRVSCVSYVVTDAHVLCPSGSGLAILSGTGEEPGRDETTGKRVSGLTPEPQFRSRKFYKKTVDFPSHRIFGRMHEAINIDKK